jgi:hypothetical protein
MLLDLRKHMLYRIIGRGSYADYENDKGNKRNERQQTIFSRHRGLAG